ncbi:MAG TPA: hypothetical protein VGH09_12495 [Solirubrobacteraceae bacterium]|jgi:hypothetical protein
MSTFSVIADLTNRVDVLERTGTAELEARLTAAEARAADLERVLVGLIHAHRSGRISEPGREAWRRLRDEPLE